MAHLPRSIWTGGVTTRSRKIHISVPVHTRRNAGGRKEQIRAGDVPGAPTQDMGLAGTHNGEQGPKAA